MTGEVKANSIAKHRGHGDSTENTESAERDGKTMNLLRASGLTANSDCAKVQDYAAAISWQAEISLRTEARKQHELIELML